jgi:hypothetical protein
MAAELRSPRRRPQGRSEDPAAVERGGWDEVEQPEHDVDPRQPAQRGDDEARNPSEFQSHGDGARDQAQQKADGGADACDAKISSGRSGLASQGGDASEDPQGQAVNLDALPPSDECVAHLVGEERRVEGGAGDDGGGEVRAVGASCRSPAASEGSWL